MSQLYDQYSKLVYSLSLRILHDPACAEDVVQEGFLHIWRSPDRVTRDRSLAPHDAVMARNRSINIVKKRRLYESIEDVHPASS